MALISVSLRGCVLWALVASATATGLALAQQPEPRAKVAITKLECRKVDAESSIRIDAFDQNGKPAEGLWVDATTKEHGREHSVQIDGTGVGKLWVGRDRAYVVHAYGYPFQADVKLRGIRVPLNCELQVRVTVFRPAQPPDIIY
jgi:hypothetical protein